MKKSGFALKSILSAILIILMVLSLAACADKNTEEAKDAPIVETEAPVSYDYTVAVLESASEEDREAVFVGFCSALEASGYKDGENILILRSTPDETDALETYAKSYVEKDVDVILAVGEDAAKAAASVTDTVPVIFACVEDPIEAELLTSCEVPDKNITGVSDFVPVYHQMEFIRKTLPKTKNISVLYCETDPTSILIASLVQEESKDFAFNCQVFTATTERDLTTSLTKSLDDADLLYLPEDTLTEAMFSKILKAATDKKVPIASSGELLVSKGAFLTVIPDYKELGYTAGEMVLALLKGLKTVGEMPVIYPEECISLVNRTAAKSLGIDITGIKPGKTLVITKTE